ncbi:DUF1992 domain-containing protein [Lysobacter korlensis]|uniref:DUF1992 domain-containing protein n=1 Tax=Lysobacter korlensis TaxID=553636 RepID=A0ABV6S1N5_9GAMM
MTTNRPRNDARLAAARYQVDRVVPSDQEQAEDASEAGRLTPEERAGMVEIAIQQAMRRGDFDDLPGAGRPIPGLDRVHDPDWWIRRKIEREGLTGLGPPALTLRTEDAHLSERLDRMASETAVRELLEDFNTRVREARRQLQGGPPVITPTRDIDAEVAAWRERREIRRRTAEQEREREQATREAMSWRERRRAKRGK